MQGNHAQQVVSGLGPFFRHAAAEDVARQLRVGNVVGGNALAKRLAVGANATDGDAAKVDAVVALLTPDHDGLAGLPLGAPVGARHFERGVG